MTGLDPRRHAFRPDLADASLRGKVQADRFVEGEIKRLIVPSIELHAAPRTDQPATTEVMWGEDIRVFEEAKDWAFVQLLGDGYVGYLAREALGPATEALTHRVSCQWGYGFKAPNIKSNLRMVLPMGARIAGDLQGDFLTLTGGLYMPRQHASPLASSAPDFVAVAERFLGTPYRWGGKTALGLDCSGLVQISLHAAGVDCPRDSDMQAAEVGVILPKADWSHLQRGDLVFWRGHVGVMTDPAHLLHANGHHMAATRELLVTVIGRAEATGSAVTTVRRLKI